MAGRSETGQRLDALPISGFHYRMVALISAGLFLDGFDVYLGGGVLGTMLKSGESTLEKNALFVSMTFAGMMLGALAAGIVGDRYGRRVSYQTNLLIFGLASLAAGFAPNMDWLIVLRFIMGIGLGAELAIGYATIAEFVPPQSRGRWIAISSLIANTSLLASAWVGYLVMGTFGWRPMFLIVGVGAVVLWFLRKNMPESPRWLEDKQRFDEAEQVLQKIEAECGVTKGSLIRHPKSADDHKISILVLFQRGVIWRTILAVAINVSLGFANYGLIAWLPSFFVREGLSIASSLLFTTIMSAGGPIGALLGFLLADRVNRRPIMIIAPAVSAALALIYPHVHDPVLLIAVGFCMVSSIFLWLTIGFLLQTEFFATEYRLRGTGFASMVGRLATTGVPFAVVWALNWGGVSAVVTMVATVLLTLSAMFLIGGIETRQKPLEALAVKTET
jgi:putative MFS transporter